MAVWVLLSSSVHRAGPRGSSSTGALQQHSPCALACREPLLGDLDAVLSPWGSSKHCLPGTDSNVTVSPAPCLMAAFPSRVNSLLVCFPI